MAGPVKPNQPNPNRPVQHPVRIGNNNATPNSNSSSAPAPVEGKGKQPYKPTPEEETKQIKREVKAFLRAERWAAEKADYDAIDAAKNMSVGAGPSGVAHEKPTPPPTPKALSRSMPETSKFSLNSQDIRNFQEEIHKADKLPSTWKTGSTRPVVDKAPLRNEKTVTDMNHADHEPAKPLEPSRRGFTIDPLDTDVRLPDIGSGPSTPATRPHAGQDGRVTFPDSPSSNSSTSADWELPDSQHAQPRPPERKLPLGKFTIKQRIGMAVASAIGVGGLIVAKVVGSDNDSSNDIET